MIDHTGVTVSDYKKSKLFYEKALNPIGYKMLIEVPTEHTGGVGVCGFGEPPKADFWISEGTPNRPHYHENYYGAFVLDPDGHSIEAVFHG